ncbi:hypothetical protein GOP47_0020357 [Adiantum capillus-veneris]|uniref:RRM domain-containing protein n=1 Tax=Adiantum capillus-veneris TaxID=13818 RepID=A0A9D4Z9H5_ADICA|nr:hypothetical protein GOP47_0020357 [Adiantum capillus-veneris]
MDASKKRKLDEPAEEVEDEVEEDDEDEDEEDEEQQNGAAQGDGGVDADEVRALIEPFTKEQIVDLLLQAALADSQVLSKIRKLADRDPAHRKLFVRGLGWDITVDSLKAIFAQYGEIEECSVIKDKQTGKSKGYGFVTYKHMDAARRALKEPSKKIEGRVTVSQLASVGPSVPSNDQSGRKIYVGNVPHDLSAEKLLSVFAQYGDVEEGPLGFDKVSGKSKGYALFVYKSAESAKKALKDPSKTIDGHQVNCKMATSDGGHKPKMDMSDLVAQSGGIVGAAPNLALSGLLPLNQGILGQHSLAGLFTGLNPGSSLAGLNPSLHASVAHQLALGSSINPSLNQSLNSSLPSTLNASLPQGVSQGLSQAALGTYGLHGLGMYGSQVAGLGGAGASTLYGGAVGSQSGILQGSGQGYTSAQLGQGSTGRSQSLSGYFGN